MNMQELEKLIIDYEEYLAERGLNLNTIKKYKYDLNLILKELDSSTLVDQQFFDGYIKKLCETHKATSVNSYICSYNLFFKWCNEPIYIKRLKISKANSIENVISKKQYGDLINYAKEKNKMKEYVLITVLSNTGIRVGEVKYVTVEALAEKGMWVNNKGKFRYVCFSNKLCELLEKYCIKNDIHSGYIFKGRNKLNPISEKAIWIMLKRLARQAGVDEENVYPHSFRHFFAKLYLDETGNLSDLADVLGHSNVETTRIYTRTSLDEKRRIMDKIIIEI